MGVNYNKIRLPDEPKIPDHISNISDALMDMFKEMTYCLDNEEDLDLDKVISWMDDCRSTISDIAEGTICDLSKVSESITSLKDWGQELTNCCEEYKDSLTETEKQWEEELRSQAVSYEKTITDLEDELFDLKEYIKDLETV